MASKPCNISLTPELEKWATEKVRDGGYNNLSEVIRDALRFKRAAEDAEFLQPRPLKPGIMSRIYAAETKEERALEASAARASIRASRRIKPEEA